MWHNFATVPPTTQKPRIDEFEFCVSWEPVFDALQLFTMLREE